MIRLTLEEVKNIIQMFETKDKYLEAISYKITFANGEVLEVIA
jgi:hypothetical protein